MNNNNEFSPGVAVFLSFLMPGLGQMYRGKVAEGCIWLILTIIGYVFVVPGIILHLICIMKAAMR